ncbi:MAG: HisA/HisF-related TIM barrel protein [Methanomassiliicoccales archaeon]
MKVLPAVDIMDGRVVQLVGGVPGTERVSLPDPGKMALEWQEKGAPGIHVVDLDAAMGRGSNSEAVEDIIHRVEVPVQVGGGIRSEETVSRLLGEGAASVIVGSRAVSDHLWLEGVATRHPGRVIVALDVKEGRIQVRGWQESSEITLEEMFDRIAPLPLAAVLHTNVDVEGRSQGIDTGSVDDFVSKCPHPVIASGGISSLEDLDALEGLGVEAVVLGVSLYTGKLNAVDVWGRYDERGEGGQDHQGDGHRDRAGDRR